MLLMVFWASLGLILGALGACLGVLLVLLQAFGGTLTSQDFCFGALAASSCPPRSPQQPQTTPQAPYVHLNWLFFLSWTLLVMILTSQAVPPILKNLDFAHAGAQFVKNQGFGSEDALSNFWWISRAEPSTTPNSSPSALMARQKAPRSHQIPSGHVFRRIFLRFGCEINEKKKA